VDLASSGFAGFLLLVIVLFAASTALSAGTMRREIRHARARRQEVPPIVRWWPRVVRRRLALLGVGALLIALGAGAFAAGLGAAGRVLVTLGLFALCYLAQAHVLAAIARRAGA